MRDRFVFEKATAIVHESQYVKYPPRMEQPELTKCKHVLGPETWWECDGPANCLECIAMQDHQPPLSELLEFNDKGQATDFADAWRQSFERGLKKGMSG